MVFMSINPKLSEILHHFAKKFSLLFTSFPLYGERNNAVYNLQGQRIKTLQKGCWHHLLFRLYQILKTGSSK